MKTYEFTTIKGEQTPIASFTFNSNKLIPNAINELENLIIENSKGQLYLGYDNTTEGRHFTLETREKHPDYFGVSNYSKFPWTTLTIYRGHPYTVGWLCTEY